MYNKVAYLRGAFTTLDNAKALLDTAVETENSTENTVTELTAERDEDVRELTAVEHERTAYGNRVQQVNQALYTARQAAPQADTRRIRAKAATQTARQELEQAREELETETTRRDALEEAFVQLARERDASVVEILGILVIRERVEEENEDVERLTTKMDEL